MKKLTGIILLLILCQANQVFGQSAYEHIRLADTLLFDDKYEEAADHLKKADSLLSRSPDQATQMYYQIILGDYHLTLQKYPEAEEAYLPLLDVSPPSDKKMRLKLAKAINDLGIVYYHLAKMDHAQRMHVKSLEIYQGDLQGASYNYNNLALIAWQLKKPDSAMLYYNKALQASEEIRDSVGIAYLNLNLGVLETTQGNEITALDNFFASRRMARALKNDRLEMQATSKLAAAYLRLGDYENAQHYFGLMEAFYKEPFRPRQLGNVYTHLGGMYSNLNQPDSTILYANKALALFRPIDNVRGMADSYKLLGNSYKKQKDYSRAEVFLDSALLLSQGKYSNLANNVSLALADLRMKQGNYQQAITLAQSISDEDNKLSDGSRYLREKVLAGSYRALGEYEEAIDHLAQAMEIKDSVYSQEKALEIARSEYVDKMTEQETLQKTEQARQEMIYAQERDRNRWYLYSAIGGLILLALLAYTFYRNIQIKKEDNRLLSEQNETIADYNTRLVSMNENVARKNEELQTKNEELKELREKETHHLRYEKELMEESIAIKERELAANIMVSHEKNAMLTSLEKQLGDLQAKAGDLKPEVETIRKTVRSQLNTNDTWNSFLHQFEAVHPKFFETLKTKHPELTVNELKLCAYIKIGMGNKEIASASNLAHSTVKKNINRLKKKLGLLPEDSVRNYLIIEP